MLRTIPQQPTAGTSQDWRGTAPSGTSARFGEEPPNKSKQQAQQRLAGNCTHRDLSWDCRGTTPSKPTARLSRIGVELHPGGPQTGLARDHPAKASSRPRPRLVGNCVPGTSASIGRKPLHNSQQQAQARIGCKLHPQGHQPGFARDNPTKASSTTKPRLSANSTHRDFRQDWKGTDQQKPA